MGEVYRLAELEKAVPAWLTISVDTHASSYSAYFGLLKHIGNRRSVPMTQAARKRYLTLADREIDARIKPHLLNA